MKWCLVLCWLLLTSAAKAQSYTNPPSDFGMAGPYNVFVNTFTNPVYPTDSGGADSLVISVFHPNAVITGSPPTIFFAHGYTSPIGNANDYGLLLTNLASQGYNVVFSPYEGGLNPNIARRFDQLTTGFEAAVTNFGLNTLQVGFAGHSYGGGFLPSVILHEMMGKADLYSPGHTWGATSAFFFSMAPGYAYSGGGNTDVYGNEPITFPTNLYVVEQIYNDDTTFADPRLAIDIFYNTTIPNSQKEFLTVYGDSHGSPAQVANHFLPNAGVANPATNLAAWAIFRHIDALAAYTFTGDSSARQIALGHGAATEITEGTWSDGVPFTPLNATLLPGPANYDTGPYVVAWTNSANPRNKFPEISGPPFITSVSVGNGLARVTASNVFSGHTYVEQASATLMPPNWTNVLQFAAPLSGSQANPPVTLTNDVHGAASLFWRIWQP